jgi:methylenetetrahydrofolate dehydrogenase (NADP+) / methenyltetrahydrofolate cyclohydrolase
LTAIVIGRSILVGKPVSALLLQRNATVVQAHSKTRDLARLCAAADIVVAAVGIPNLVQADWVREGAVVIDVGINRNSDGKLCGDVDFAAVAPKCRAITPVPGGVGPMTIAMLMENTLRICKERLGNR